MKWDVELPGLDHVVRLEVKTRKEGERWASYISLAVSAHEHLCWLIGEGGLPFRFEGLTEEKVQAQAKDCLERTYKVVRKIWK